MPNGITLDNSSGILKGSTSDISGKVYLILLDCIKYTIQRKVDNIITEFSFNLMVADETLKLDDQLFNNCIPTTISSFEYNYSIDMNLYFHNSLNPTDVNFPRLADYYSPLEINYNLKNLIEKVNSTEYNRLNDIILPSIKYWIKKAISIRKIKDQGLLPRCEIIYPINEDDEYV